MNSIILQIASRLLMAIFLLFSLLVLYRGHNDPGGGFIGGLLAAAAFALYAMANGIAAARHVFRFQPQMMIGSGLLLALLSALPSVLMGEPIMTGQWLMLAGKLPLGTPLLFDIGVYFVVIGITVNIIFSLAEEES